MTRKILKAFLHFLVLIVYRVKKVGEENLPKERKIYYICKSCSCNGCSITCRNFKEKDYYDCKRGIV